jgi:hypothetical protein
MKFLLFALVTLPQLAVAVPTSLYASNPARTSVARDEADDLDAKIGEVIAELEAYDAKETELIMMQIPG